MGGTLSSTGVTVLLMSASFLTSSFVRGGRLPPVLEGTRTRGAGILYLLMRPDFFLGSRLSTFRTMGGPRRALTRVRGPTRREMFLGLVSRVREVVRVR